MKKFRNWQTPLRAINLPERFVSKYFSYCLNHNIDIMEFTQDAILEKLIKYDEEQENNNESQDLSEDGRVQD